MILEYTNLEKMGDQVVYRLALPLFFEDKVKSKWPLDKILESVRVTASTLVNRETNPKAVKTKEEWVAAMLESRKKYLLERIEYENRVISLLETL